MKEDLHLRLIYKSLKEELSPQEQKQLDSWLGQKIENQKLRDQIRQEWSLSEKYEPELQIDTKADFQRLKGRIQRHDQTVKNTSTTRITAINRRWLSVAAGIILLLGLGWWFWPQASAESVNTVAQTGPGEKRALLLADGSTVWLNENSSLTFPSYFSGELRTVQLEGEAFFSVKPNPDKPFLIQIPEGPQVEVLGTSFLVQAFPAAANVVVEVASGKVRLEDTTNDEQLILQKGDRGKWISTERSITKEVDANPNIYAWQTNTLLFSEAQLSQVITDIEQYFNVVIEVENSAISNCVFSGRFPNATLEEILTAVSFSLNLEWQVTREDTYLLRGEGC